MWRVGALSLFLFHFYVPASVQYKNCLVIPNLMWFHRKKSCLCSGTQQTHRTTTTTMATIGGNGPLMPQIGITPHNNMLVGWATTPQASGYNFGGSEGVYGSKSTPLFRQWCIAAPSKCFEGHTPPQPPKNFIGLLVGHHPLSKDNSSGHKASCAALGGCFHRQQMWLAIVVIVVVGWWRQIF